LEDYQDPQIDEAKKAMDELGISLMRGKIEALEKKVAELTERADDQRAAYNYVVLTTPDCGRMRLRLKSENWWE